MGMFVPSLHTYIQSTNSDSTILCDVQQNLSWDCRWLLLYHYLSSTVICPTLSAPANGSISLSGVTVGDIANYSCNEEFELVGNATRVCLDDGTWSGQDPVCNPSKCDCVLIWL